MKPNWIGNYLTESVSKKLCTSIGCTTCGALEFRKGVLTAFGSVSGRSPPQHLDRETCLEITKSLATFEPRHLPTLTSEYKEISEIECAVRCLLFDLWRVWPNIHYEIEELLSRTWVGNILDKMKKHHADRKEKQRIHEEFNSPDSVGKRREERALLKREKNEKRFMIKVERERIWHQKKQTIIY